MKRYKTLKKGDKKNADYKCNNCNSYVTYDKIVRQIGVFEELRCPFCQSGKAFFKLEPKVIRKRKAR